MKTTLAIFGVLFALCAKADYLYWMVNTESAGAYDYTSAVLKMVDDVTVKTIDSSTVELAGYTGEENLNAIIASYQSDAGGFFTVLPDGYSGKAFYVELYNGDKWLAQTTPTSNYSGAIYAGGLSVPTAAPTSLGGTYAVPEPTSGLLFVIGGMLLGLKRKRQV